MELQATDIPGIVLLKSWYFSDERGYFVETYNKRSAQDLGLRACFVQDNQSLSVQRGTIEDCISRYLQGHRQSWSAFCAAAFMMSSSICALAPRPMVIGQQ